MSSLDHGDSVSIAPRVVAATAADRGGDPLQPANRLSARAIPYTAAFPATLARGELVGTVFASLPQFLVACLILAGAQAVYVLLGFGAGMVAVGLLALLLPELRDVIVILLLVNLPAEVYVVTASWRRVAWREVLLVMTGVAAGIPLGSWLLSSGDLGALLTLLGLVMVMVGGVFQLSPNRPPRPVPAWTAPPVGLVSGVLTGLFGTGGPPLIVYSQLRGDDKTAFRGTLMAIFLMMTLVRVPTYAAFGLITAPRLWSSLALLPAAMLGALVGDRIHLRIDEATFRRLVNLGLVAIGIMLLVRSL